MSFEGLLSRRLSRGDFALFGEQAELESLFGAPLPVLPPGEKEDEGEEKIFVKTDPELQVLFGRCLSYLAHSMGWIPDSTGGREAGVPEKSVLEYEEILAATLRQVVLCDRRQGLVNLFWLVHSLEVAQTIEHFFHAGGSGADIRYRIHPLLSGLYHRVEIKVFESFSRVEARKVNFRLGPRRNTSLVGAIMNDQLPLTDVDLATFDPDRILVPGNRRFSFSAPAFRSISSALGRRVEAGVRRGEKPLMHLLRTMAPSIAPEEALGEKSMERYLWHRQVAKYLFRDVEGVLLPLTKNNALVSEKNSAGTWAALFGRYLDFIDCLLRGQAITAMRECLVLEKKGLGDRETRQKRLEGRLYCFARGEEVVSDVRKVTVLFGDVREFTRHSEGAVSERNLVAALTRIFDPAAMVIHGAGGRIDKFLGDGFMATFGTGQAGDTGPLPALRAAVAIQHMMSRLRERGEADFHMGMSLHAGRVAIARFLPDEEREEVTPIGRQVNIAGRLSSSKSATLDLDAREARLRRDQIRKAGIKASTRTVGGVTVDAENNLINNGIAVSGAVVNELRAVVALKPFRIEERSGFTHFDPQTRMRMVFDYVGEALFKGIEGAVTIYSLTAEAERGAPKAGSLSERVFKEHMDEK